MPGGRYLPDRNSKSLRFVAVAVAVAVDAHVVGGNESAAGVSDERTIPIFMRVAENNQTSG